ncbi:MAG: ATP-binding cassette domain-containing protein [Desulfobacter sp.]|nr:MAG: ATP-binding cassette domain-containing protein [Desulfobacter sp.]
MKELFRRLFKQPVLAVEILVATCLTTLLSLAMPLYVIQILNRYVSYGFHGTLITLTLGMCIAVFLQLGFRMVRTRMATAVNQGPNDSLSREMLTLISQAQAAPLLGIPKQDIHDSLTHVQTIRQAYDAQTLTAVLDAPFSLVLVGVLYLLSPVLAGIALGGISITLGSAWITLARSGRTGNLLGSAVSAHQGLNFSVVNGLETVKAFCAAPFLWNKWENQLATISDLQARLSAYRDLLTTLTLTVSALTSVFIYAGGAILVVQGKLSVGALIGANILFGRAFQNTTRLVQAAFALARARKSFQALAKFSTIPLEPAAGTALGRYHGKLECQDLGFAYPNTTTPLFESLTLTLEPGSVVGVTGSNGTGKTTLAKLLTCLLNTRRGKILADGVNLAQISPSWWRRQVIYMPQEPDFILGSLRENILLSNPDLSNERFNEIIRLADLRPFLDRTPQGLDRQIAENGRDLPQGIRQRISLARALAGQGQLVILDEPTDGLDAQGVQAVYQTMNYLAESKKTIVVLTNDPKILKGGEMVLNLNKKPVPVLIRKNYRSDQRP